MWYIYGYIYNIADTIYRLEPNISWNISADRYIGRALLKTIWAYSNKSKIKKQWAKRNLVLAYWYDGLCSCIYQGV